MQRAQCSRDVLAVLPGLAAALAGIELDQVCEGQAVRVLRACAAQLAHDHARFLAAMVQLGRVSSAQARDDEAAGKVALEWAGAEIGAALSWTTGKADRELRVAQFPVDRLPSVYAELAAGRIDQGRAWTFVDVLDDAELTDTQLARVCAIVVPTAHRLTNGRDPGATAQAADQHRPRLRRPAPPQSRPRTQRARLPGPRRRRGDHRLRAGRRGGRRGV